MTVPEIETVVDAWTAQYLELSANPFVQHVQIFENCGAMMGASNPHPHCQIWSGASIPNEVAKEQGSLDAWKSERGSCLLCDYLALELADGSRIVERNSSFVTLVPFWAVWPFETIVIATRHVTGVDGLRPEERDGLADILKRTTARYDRLFDVSFPYTMGFHQRPVNGGAHEEWHLHAHFYPPLLRSATVRKFMVGYEMLGTPQRDITPEAAAARLRECGETV
jgi:UDPglucose--hexose-1-phosphate uridylyltransferase